MKFVFDLDGTLSFDYMTIDEEIQQVLLNASDYGQLATLQRDLDAANETLLEKYERYEYLSELEG